MIKIKLSFIILALMFVAIKSSLSQVHEKIILGKVIDGQTFDSLPYANIAFINSDIGTSSGNNGTFSIRNSISAKELLISYVGYKGLIIDLDNINNNEENVFALLPINIFLQEVTVYSNTNKQVELSEISSLSLQSERIREISVGMPDILR